MRWITGKRAEDDLVYAKASGISSGMRGRWRSAEGAEGDS